MRRPLGAYSMLSGNHARVEGATVLPAGDVLLWGWHPRPGEMVLILDEGQVTAIRSEREDLSEALGRPDAFAFLGLLPPTRSGLPPTSLTYQVDGQRRRRVFLRAAPVQEGLLRERVVDAFGRSKPTTADLVDCFRPLMEAMDQGAAHLPATLTPLEFALRYFDPAYYLRANFDVADAGVDPTTHWVQSGRNEGRSPHPLFDARWYAGHYGGTAHDALASYLESGWMLGNRPSPLIDPAAVSAVSPLGANPLIWLADELHRGRDVDAGDLGTARIASALGLADASPLEVVVEYLIDGWALPWPASWTGVREPAYEADGDWQSGTDPEPQPARAPVSVVLPVHGIGAPMDRCVRALVADLGPTDEVVLVFDHDQPPTWSALDAVRDHRWTVVTTGGGRGFSGAVNVGVARATPGHDLVILNSDAVLPRGALDGLVRHGEAHPSAASVSALSNHGSLASYPLPAHGSPLVPGGTPAGIAAAAARANPGESVPAPTAIGHCMWIRRAAWDNVGLLDAARFPQGYGEENDWSLRAEAAGWTHRVALDTLVWHQGSSSFGRARARELTRAGLRTLESLHPGSVRRFMGAGEAYSEATRDAYTRLDAARVRDEFAPVGGIRRVVVTHTMGGGIDEFIRRESRIDTSTDVLLLLDARAPTFTVRCARLPIPHLDGTRSKPHVRELAAILALLDPSEIEVHSVVNGKPERVITELLKPGAPVRLFQHDYFLACPRVTMMGGTAPSSRPQYCGGEQDASACDACLTKWGSHYYSGPVTEWRALGRELHQRAAERWTSSRESGAVLVPFGLGAREWSHVKAGAPRVDAPDRRRPNVLVVGSIGEHKGAGLVRSVSAINRLEGGPLILGLMGTFDTKFGQYLQVFDVIYGPYDNTALAPFADPPDVVWLPSVWPETHLYTIDDAALMAPDATCAVLDMGGAQLRRAQESFAEVLTLGSGDAAQTYRALVAAVEARTRASDA